jgi:hypothetical protein
MISLEQYANLCVLMTDTNGNEAQEVAIAIARGVAGPAWLEAKAYYTAKMMDASDMGRTAMAFQPIYQSAQARLCSGIEPCPLELYTKIHAEMAYRRDASGKKVNYQLVLAEHGHTHQSWLECEVYWTPRVASNVDPKFDIAAATRFRSLLQEEHDRIFGIDR